jgi:hypothetical protein
MFGLVNTFIEILELATTSNYNITAKLHSVQVTIAYAILSQTAASSSVVAW